MDDVTVTYPDDVAPFTCEVHADETVCSAQPIGYTFFTARIGAPRYLSEDLVLQLPSEYYAYPNCDCAVDAQVVLEPR